MSFDWSAAKQWITKHVSVTGEIKVARDRPWAVVLRVPTKRGDVWFKACRPVQRFEPYLTRELSSRWPQLISEVLACDDQRSWMLTADAGTSLGARGNRPEDWLAILPRYAQLQAGEVMHAHQHIDHGVPDLRVAKLPARYHDLLAAELPIDHADKNRFSGLGPGFAEMCCELCQYGIPDSIQHDDLHLFNVYEKNGQLRIMDWGDASIGHPFASVFETFRFLQEANGLRPDNPWYGKLRDAYLEPWGPDLLDAFDLGLRVAAVSHAIAWVRQRSYLPQSWWPTFDQGFTGILRRALNALTPPGE